MKKNIKKALLCIVLVGILVSSAILPVFATDSDAIFLFVYDEAEWMTYEEAEELDYALWEFEVETGIGIFAFTRDFESNYPDLTWDEYAATVLEDGSFKESAPDGGIALIIDAIDNTISIYTYGVANDIIFESENDDIFYAMVGLDSEGLVFDAFFAGAGVAADAVLEYLESGSTPSTTPEDSGSDTETEPEAAITSPYIPGEVFVVDDANLFSDVEELKLTERILEIREDYNVDINFITTTTTDGLTIKEYLDTHPSLDTSRDGIVFGQNTSERDYYTTSRGYGITVVTDEALDRIDEVIVPYLQDDDFYGAYDKYLDETTKFLAAAATGVTYSGEPTTSEDIMVAAIIGIIAGIIVAFVVTGVMKSAMNTARKKQEASDYVKQDSFILEQSYDRYLYENTTRSAKQSSSSSSGGRSSGGGSSRGGSGGGKY